MAYQLAWLQGNQGVTDDGIAHIGRMSELKSLELQFCWQLTDAGVSLPCANRKLALPILVQHACQKLGLNVCY